MKKLIGIMLTATAILASCEGVDCTLNNIVLCHYFFYDSETGDQISLADTLTITASGTDSVLYNHGVNTDGVSIPMSYQGETDTLTLHLYSEGYYCPCTLFVSKTNTPHYESPDCPTTMFHYLTGVEWNGEVIDSVVIGRAEVNYLQDENIKVYFRTSD